MVNFEKPTIDAPSTNERVVELYKYLLKLVDQLQFDAEDTDKRLRKLEEENGN